MKGEKYVIRLKMSKEGEAKVVDLIRGEVSFQNSLQDDFIILKSDGFPTYHLASVVDDNAMRISHVIRGEEWLSSLPKHLQLYTYFGWPIPAFAHLPLLLNPDKSKLSKRQGDVAVADYEAKGYLPEALLNFVAFLGWNPGTDKELYSLSELISDFSLERVSTSGAVFNLEKLNWYNREYIKKLSNTELVQRSLPWLANIDSVAEYSGLEMEKVIELERERVTTLSELPEALRFVFEIDDYEGDVLIWRKGTREEVQKILPELKIFFDTIRLEDWNRSTLETKAGEWIAAHGYSVGSVLWPLRVALSGQRNSPGPYEIAAVLGKEISLRRVEAAISKLAEV